MGEIIHEETKYGLECFCYNYCGVYIIAVECPEQNKTPKSLEFLKLVEDHGVTYSEHSSFVINIFENRTGDWYDKLFYIIPIQNIPDCSNTEEEAIRELLLLADAIAEHWGLSEPVIQMPRGDGVNCILCHDFNPWGGPNLGVEEHYACYSCKTTKKYLINKKLKELEK